MIKAFCPLLLSLLLSYPLQPVSADQETTAISSKKLGKLFNSDAMENIFFEGIVVDLKEPSYSDGTISTTEGGVISGPNIRIQAQKLKYVRKLVNGKSVFNVEAEGNLMIEFGNHIFIGNSMFFDFNEKTGYVYGGRSVVEPWYFGGEKFILNPDGSYTIENGYITTSVSRDPDWQISTSKVQIHRNTLLNAKNVKFKLLKLPVFWFPRYKTDLKTIKSSPIKYRVRWGGSRGPVIGLNYNLYNVDNWKTDLRLDANLKQGLGAGLETKYTSDDQLRQIFSSSYYANDRSTADPNKRNRYRLSGYYHDHFKEKSITADLTYDIVSDEEMPGDYRESGIFRRTVERNQFIVRQQTCSWIWHAYSKARFNTFRTIKQEIPAFTISKRPFNLGNTGIISDNTLHASYINYKYSKFLFSPPGNYKSFRGEWNTSLSRPYQSKYINIIPDLGFVGLFYSNSPTSKEESVGVLKGNLNINTAFYRCYNESKHLVKPYVDYLYQESTSSPISDHYVFDIHDSWTDLHRLKFGVFNTLFKKQDCDISHVFDFDIYSILFFGDHNQPRNIPRIYSELIWDSFNNVRTSIDTAWDLERGELSHFNFKSEYTHDENFATSFEFLHRNEYSWRKVDKDNLHLNVFYPESTLLASALSDRRSTFLLHAYWHFKINWTVEIHTRHGWDRSLEPRYNEYQVDLSTIYRSSWKLRWSCQLREDDTRFAFFISLGEKKPTKRTENPYAMGLGTY